MKIKLLSLIIIASLLLVAAAVRIPEPNPNNLLTNPGWETNTSGWAASAGTYTRNTTAANIGYGNGSAKWASTGGAGRTLTSTAVAIPKGLYNRNGVASCNIQVPTGSSTHLLQAYDGTNILSSSAIISSATFTRTSVNFPFGSSGNISLRIISVSASEPDIYIDDCILGDATLLNISQISQAMFIGSAYIANTANCAPERTNTVLGAFGADADCPGPTIASNPGPGTILTTDTNLPKFTVNNLPAGTYEITMKGNLYTDALLADLSVGINDGDTTSGQMAVQAGTTTPLVAPFTTVGIFTYTTSGNRTFELYGASSVTKILYKADSLVGGQRHLRFIIKRFPSSAETAFNVGQISYPTRQSFTSGTGTYTLPTNPRPTSIVVRMVGGGGGGGGSGAGGSIAAGGAGGESQFYVLGASATSLLRSLGGGGGAKAGDAGATNGGTTAVALPAISVLSLTGTSGASAPNANSVAYLPGGGGASSFFGGGGGVSIHSAGAAATANTGSGGQGGGSGAAATVVAQGGGAGAYVEALINGPNPSYTYVVGAAGTAGVAGANGYAGGTGAAGFIEVIEYYGNSTPILVGSVSSNSNGAERVERASLTGDATTCTITNQSGTWIASGARNAAGDCTWTINSGIFSESPVCTCTVYASASQAICNIDSGTVPTSTVIRTQRYAGGADQDGPIYLICVGPR
jgi:hypothetical protein